MGINKEKIGAAFRQFMDKEYVQAKEDLSQEIRLAKGEFLQRKLGLERNPQGVSCFRSQGL
jgi:hypothetical protein